MCISTCFNLSVFVFFEGGEVPIIGVADPLGLYSAGHSI